MLVLLLDIDGTLIGNISPQLMLWDMGSKIHLKPSIVKSAIQQSLKNGVVRPYFKEFFDGLSAHGVEFFIYTASEKHWAEYIVKQIEQAYNVKFNRPLFTRNNCTPCGGDYTKHIHKVMPAIMRTLKRKHTYLTFKDLRNRVIAVDNNQVYKDPRQLILCETYDMYLPENIPAIVSQTEYSKHHDVLHQLLHSYKFFMKKTSNYLKFQRHYYASYITYLTAALQLKQKPDTFFRVLKEIIVHRGIQTFTEDNIKLINAKLKQHVSVV